jgi:carbon-monoxide dehydrogenase medium subunit
VVPVEDFCTGPGKTVLEDDELLLSLRLPPPPADSASFFLRFIPRNEMDIAVVNAAASIALDEDRRTIRSARVALGAVAPTPLLVTEAADALVGGEGSEQDIENAAEAAKSAARPITDMRGTAAQRRHLSAVLVRRAITGALARAKAPEVPRS